jgi:N-acyl-D-amino-acid deacylase
MKTLIKNATVVDGVLTAASVKDVLIEDEKIIQVEAHIDESVADLKVDAEGFMLTPGFIDSHSHSDISILAAPDAEGKISQGITTEIVGNCGLSVFPITDLNREHLQELYSNYNVELSWSNADEYADLVNAAKPITNIASMCGHNTLRASIMGYKDILITDEHIEQMQSLLKQTLDEGVGGLSTGLLYVPGKFADEIELEKLLDVVSSKNKIYTTHMRNEGDFVLEAVKEAIGVAKKTKTKLHISHLKTSGRANWEKAKAITDEIEAARQEGFHVTADRYPYVESMTSLSVVLPSPYDNKDDISLNKMLKEPINFDALVNKLEEKARRPYLDAILVSSRYHKVQNFFGRTIADIAKALEMSPSLLVAEIIQGDPISVAAFSTMSPDNLCHFMKQPYLCCGSDESARPVGYHIGRSHPRGFGSLPRFIKLATQWATIEEVISKITYLPASIFNLKNRGVIKPGYYADLTLLKLDELQACANFAEPHAISKGIRAVWVNGVLSFAKNEVCNPRGGRFLKLP